MAVTFLLEWITPGALIRALPAIFKSVKLAAALLLSLIKNTLTPVVKVIKTCSVFVFNHHMWLATLTGKSVALLVILWGFLHWAKFQHNKA
jgi:hypothetical protein